MTIQTENQDQSQETPDVKVINFDPNAGILDDDFDDTGLAIWLDRELEKCNYN